MNHNKIYRQLLEKKAAGQKTWSILIDPDRSRPADLENLLRDNAQNLPDIFLVGGSLITEGETEETVRLLKNQTDRPVVLFPGNAAHLCARADGLLFLSLISGRNPEYLIGQQVTAAPFVRKSGLEVIPTGYMLVDCGRPTTASYISNTFPLPYDKPEIAAATALAGELLGLKMIYLDGGSGAAKPVSPAMIRAVRKSIGSLLTVGGGLRSPEAFRAAYEAGADHLVVGTAAEQTPGILTEFGRIAREF